MSDNKIQVFGSGCPTCKKLFELTKKAAAELKIETEVEYSDDIQKIIELGVMQSPVLAVNGRPVMTGSTSDIEKIKQLLIGKADKSAAKNESACACGHNCC